MVNTNVLACGLAAARRRASAPTMSDISRSITTRSGSSSPASVTASGVVPGLAHDVHPGGLRTVAQTLAKEVVVVGEQDAQSVVRAIHESNIVESGARRSARGRPAWDWGR